MAVNIRKYKKSDYENTLKIANQLFYDIMGKFNNFSEEKNLNFLKDVGAFPLDETDGLYVIESDNEVAGVMNLSANEFVTKDEKSIGLLKLIFKYGLYNTWVTITVLNSLKTKLSDNELYVDYIVVDDRHRGKGLGSQLLEFGFELAKELNKEEYTLKVLSSNPRAKKLYESIGFTEVDKDVYPKFIQRMLKAECDYKLLKEVK